MYINKFCWTSILEEFGKLNCKMGVRIKRILKIVNIFYIIIDNSGRIEMIVIFK